MLASSAWAKPWQGLEPGVATRADVVKKFGEPTRTANSEGKDILAYADRGAIKGTTQAQFRVDPKSQVVERIDVFPAAVLDKDAVEGAYGPACPKGPPPEQACYEKKVTPDFRVYLAYARLGLVVFFKEDGRTVHSLVFVAEKVLAPKK